MLLNLPLVWGRLLWDLRGVDVTALTAAYATAVLAGWYVLPLLVLLGVVFLLVPVRRPVAPATALIAAVYVYYLLLTPWPTGSSGSTSTSSGWSTRSGISRAGPPACRWSPRPWR
ncbi:MAG: hypothetical protein IPI34_09500 [bacterium]|nr:hypothetical protein [bacterium]